MSLEIPKILVPVDLSDRAEPTARHAASLARHFSSKLIFMHVIPPPPYVATGGIEYPWFTWTPEQEPKQHLNDWLDSLIEKAGPHDDGVEKVVEKGDPAQRIHQFIQKKNVDLIIMSTHGYGPFRRFLLGSVTSKVLHDVDCPIFTEAHIETSPTPTSEPFRRIGCAVDLGKHSATVLDWAKGFAEAYGAELWLIHAAPSAESARSEAAQSAKEEAEQLLQKAGAEAEIRIEGGEVQSVVPKVASDEKIDLLVVGRPGEGGLLGRLKTHTYSLIRESPCPVVSL